MLSVSSVSSSSISSDLSASDRTVEARATTHRRPFVTRVALALVTGVALALSAGAAHATQGGQGPMMQGQAELAQRAKVRKKPSVLIYAFRLAKNSSELLEIYSLTGDSIKARVHIPDGQPRSVTLSPRDLVGLYWLDARCDQRRCVPAWFRIRGADRDQRKNTMAERVDSGDVWLYDVQYSTESAPTESDWHNLCTKDAQGQTDALFVHGTWNRAGAFADRAYTLACTSGAISKCIRTWGYQPWSQIPDQSGELVSLAPLHRACVRAARADYCGSGQSHTRAGTIVDIADKYGFNRRVDDSAFTRESGFDENGAVWLERTRLPLDSLPDSAPLTCQPQRFADRSGDDALLEVYSRPQS